jgi:iron complex outermembrane receptor protein
LPKRFWIGLGFVSFHRCECFDLLNRNRFAVLPPSEEKFANDCIVSFPIAAGGRVFFPGLLTGIRVYDLRKILRRAAFGFSFATLAALVALPAWPQSSPKDLAGESLEDLMNIQVTSVSKREEKVSRTGAAIFVITAEDIRRSGATNIPDLLRMVPGLDVAQISASTWAISARGFNGRFSNELLVMVDGRTVYTPSFGGVFWDAQDMPLEDIERIEVIRGPGGSVWGTNAVNGVINIITKTAGETKGVMIEAGGGNLDQEFGTLQYGGSLGANTDYRIYTKYFDEDHMPGLSGGDGGDGWRVQRGGFRMDSKFSPRDTVTVQGDIYDGREGEAQPVLASLTSPSTQLVEGEVDLSGDFIQGIWTHTYSSRSDFTLQISDQQYRRDDALRESRNTTDINFQNHLQWGDRQNIIWGLGYRISNSVSNGSLAVSLDPLNLPTHLFSSFIQDEFALVHDRLYVTVGTQVEHDHYNGFAVMPSASVVWTPDDRRTLWASVSRAVRTPAAIDASIRLNLAGFPGAGGTPTVIALVGNPSIKDEFLVAYEVGYRSTLSDRVSIDLAAYYNDYTNQQTTEPAVPFFENMPAPPHLVLPLTYGNQMYGETQGLEIFANWKLSSRWALSPGYALEQIHMHLDPGSQDTTSVQGAEGSSPENSAQLRSHLILPRGLAWDTSLFFVDRLADPVVPSYTRVDSSLTWQLREKTTLSLVGQNLLKDRHLEYEDTTDSVGNTLVKRSGYVKLTWYH